MKFLVLIALFLIATTWAQNDCDSKTKCSSCVAEAGCGWCSATQTCIKGNKDGPDSTTGKVCLGQAWMLRCPNCASFGTCRDCHAHSTDCCWNPNITTGAKCTEILLGTSCPVAQAECSCTEFPNCGECTQATGCSWCGASDSCYLTKDTQACTLPAHTCSCQSLYSCDLCNQQAGCQWCQGSDIQPASCTNSGETCPGNAPIAHSCGTYCQNVGTSCGECVSAEGCSWCETTNKCIDVSRANAECSGLIGHTCKQCLEFTYCSACQQQVGCSWCDDAGGARCLESANPSCTFFTHTCEAFCHLGSDCNSCRALKGCAWCEDTKACTDIDSATCFIAHTCPPKNHKCGFDAGSFVGGMFLIIGLVLLGGGAYLFYRWKTGLPLWPGSSWQQLD